MEKTSIRRAHAPSLALYLSHQQGPRRRAARHGAQVSRYRMDAAARAGHRPRGAREDKGGEGGRRGEGLPLLILVTAAFGANRMKQSRSLEMRQLKMHSLL